MRGGMTLLETAIVMVLILILAAAVIPFFTPMGRGEEVRKAAADLRVMARSARFAAMEQGRAVVLWVDAEGMTLARPGSGLPGEDDTLYGKDLSSGVEVTWKRPGERQWQGGDAALQWYFQPSGLCEPLTLRVERSPYWIELDFSPLTAGVMEERYELP